MKRPPAGQYYGELATKGVRFVATGEFREPKAGEHFLSSSIVTAYLAKQALSQKYWIAKAVQLETCPCCQGTGKVVKADQ